jgi:murein DD-endopeptidase MepM/ murein hydrolase activator NlpD
MAAETPGWETKLFPEIRIRIGTKAPVMLPRWLQAAFLSVLLVVAGALAYLGLSRISYKRLAADKGAAVVRAETANADLRNSVARLQEKLAASARDRKQVEGRVAELTRQTDALRGLVDSTAAKLHSLDQTQVSPSGQRGEAEHQPTLSATAAPATAGQIDELTRALEQTRQVLLHEKDQSTVLSARLGKSEADRVAEETQFAQYKADLEQTVKQIEQLGSARGKGEAQRARLRVRFGELWQKLSQGPTLPAAQQVAAAPATVPPALSEGGVAAIADFGRAQIAGLERVLASTGLDVVRLFSQFGVNPAEGGPFVPPPKAGRPADAIDPEKLAAIRGLANVLPLSAPLAEYQVGSPFGPRIDPFNHRPAFHTGIDMDAPYMSPVYATAPGTVVFAGFFGEYGKVVEIDHGFGIQTLYAHLHRFLVSVGQKVAAHAEIGLVGTTGRSSGPHVHYEVRVNGQPQDPEKFLELSRLIPIATGNLSPAAAAPAGNSR